MLLKSLPNDTKTSIKSHLLKILQPSDRASLGGTSPLMHRYLGGISEKLFLSSLQAHTGSSSFLSTRHFKFL